MLSLSPGARRIHGLFLLLLAGIALLAFALAWLHGRLVTPVAPTPELIVGFLRGMVAPKPTERFVFMVLAVLAPLAAVAAVSLRSPVLPAAGRGPAGAGMALLVALLLFLPFWGSDFCLTLLGRYSAVQPRGGRHWLGTALVLALPLAWWLSARWRAGRVPPRRATLIAAWGVFLFFVALQLGAWRWVSIASVTRSGAWSTHADPVFYPLTQVMAGATLLDSLPSQYGLFPEMLAPLLRLAGGLSVLRLSTVFAFLQCLGLAALFWTLSRLLRSRVVLLLAGLALVMAGFETVLWFVGIDERYFQYWPLRFFWPALSVAVFLWCARGFGRGRAAVLSVVGTAGLLWNMDSGLFILVAFGAWLVARALFAGQAGDRAARRGYLLALAQHAAIAVAGVAAFLFYLACKADGPLHWRWLVEYQRIFLDMGLMMLPLPRQPHPWMSVLAVYLLALVSALVTWRQRQAGPRADMAFYLAMLGLGLFVYYSGRSHVLNLVTVCWPAILLAALGADGVLRAVRARALPSWHLALPIVALALLLLAAGSLVARTPMLAGQAWRQFSTRGVVEEPFVASEVALIRRNTTRGQRCLILAQRQGLYYAETGLRSPADGPGLVEVLLQSDEDALREKLYAGRFDCVFLGAGTFSHPGLGVMLETVLRVYREVDRSADGTMLYLRRRS